MGSILFRFGLSFLAILSLSLNAWAIGYKDVPQAHWARPDVIKMVDEYQFMSGDPNGNFGGSRPMTRYEFAKTMSKMVEYYNQEIESDRKDLESMVAVMELFQGQVKKLETKLGTAGDSVGDQNKTLDELNEMVISLAEEVNKIDTSKPDSSKEIAELSSRVAVAEANIHKLSEKGLFVDTLVKGAFYDVKHLGAAVARATKSSRTKAHGWRDDKANLEIDTRTEVDANLKSMTEESKSLAQTSSERASSNLYSKDIEEFTKSVQTRTKEAEILEYLSPLEEKK